MKTVRDPCQLDEPTAVTLTRAHLDITGDLYDGLAPPGLPCLQNPAKFSDRSLHYQSPDPDMADVEDGVFCEAGRKVVLNSRADSHPCWSAHHVDLPWIKQ